MQDLIVHVIAKGRYDPCPPPIPIDDPLAKYLGADVIPGLKSDEDIAKFAREATITRLHLRYTKQSLAALGAPRGAVARRHSPADRSVWEESVVGTTNSSHTE